MSEAKNEAVRKFMCPSCFEFKDKPFGKCFLENQYYIANFGYTCVNYCNIGFALKGLPIELISNLSREIYIIIFNVGKLGNVNNYFPERYIPLQKVFHQGYTLVKVADIVDNRFSIYVFIGNYVDEVVLYEKG